MNYITAIQEAIQSATNSLFPLESWEIDANVHADCKLDTAHNRMKGNGVLCVSSKNRSALQNLLNALENKGFTLGRRGVNFSQVTGNFSARLHHNVVVA